MKIYKMNQRDHVLHHSYAEAVAYYEKIHEPFVDCDVEPRSVEYGLEDYRIFVNEEHEEPLQLSIKECLEKGLVDVPCLFSGED